jgi:hypothetical protein
MRFLYAVVVEPAEPAVAFDLAWIATLVGFFLPLLISFVKRSDWSTQAKRWLAVVTSIIAGLVTVGLRLGWSIDDPAGFAQGALLAVVDVWVVSAVAYQNFWKDTAIERAVESVGSPKAFDEGYNPGDPGYGTDRTD